MRGAACLLLTIAAAFHPPHAFAQDERPARFSLDSAVAIDQFEGQNTADRPNIIVDVSAVVRLGAGFMVYVRPWFRQPRAPEWETEIYQAAVQYARTGAIATRVDVGFIASPIGSGMMETRPGVNPTILPHLSYVQPMPLFDAAAPRVNAIASSYPFGAQITASSGIWDGRLAVIHTAPTRRWVLGSDSNPAASPVAVAGVGITAAVGIRFGVSVATGDYVAGEELAVPADDGRELRMVSVEAEYSAGYTTVNGEFTRDALETGTGSETAYAWFVQGVQTLSPRWFVAGRQEGVSAPPLRNGIVPGTRSRFHVSEATVGFRISEQLTLRGSFVARKAYTRSAWDQQAGASLVWARRWW